MWSVVSVFVSPTVRLFSLYLLNHLTFDLDFCSSEIESQRHTLHSIVKIYKFCRFQTWYLELINLLVHSYFIGYVLLKLWAHCVVAEDKRFVELLDFHFNDFDKLCSEYSPGANEYLQASGAAGGLVSTAKVTKVKGMWRPEYIVMNFWSSSEQFETAYKAGE